MLVEAVRIGRRHDRGEVVVADGPAWRRGAKEGEIALLIVSDRVNVVRSKPAVTFSVVVFDTAALIRVIRILKRTALELGQMMRRLELPGEIGITKSRLASVGSRQPTEKLVEGPILPPHQNSMVHTLVTTIRHATRP